MPKACHYGPMYPKIHPIEMDWPSLIVKNMGTLKKSCREASSYFSLSSTYKNKH